MSSKAKVPGPPNPQFISLIVENVRAIMDDLRKGRPIKASYTIWYLIPFLPKETQENLEDLENRLAGIYEDLNKIRGADGHDTAIKREEYLAREIRPKIRGMIREIMLELHRKGYFTQITSFKTIHPTKHMDTREDRPEERRYDERLPEDLR